MSSTIRGLLSIHLVIRVLYGTVLWLLLVTLATIQQCSQV